MRRAPTSLIAFVVAIALHVVGFGAIIALSLLAAFVAPKTPLRAKPVGVSMRPISADQWAKNRGVRKDDMKQRGPSQALPPEETQDEPQQTPEEQVAEAKPVEEKPKKEAEERPRGQTVATAPGNGEEDPDAEFLSESSNKTKRETKAKDQTPFYRNPSAKRTSPVPNHEAGNDDVDKAQREGNNGAGQDDRPLREPSERKLALEIPDMHAREQVQLEQGEKDGPGPSVANRHESAEVRGNSKRLRIQDGSPTPGADESRGKAGTPGIATLTPSISVLDKVYGGAPNDHLDDVDEGDGTYLNTREWKYASFMNRVKQSVGMRWDPVRELRMRDPTGNSYAGRDRQTVLQVTLDEHGRVKDVFVLKSSGLDFLDLEAVRSFERAQPFPNPPTGMLSEKSTVTFNFGFFLDMGGGPGPGMFR